MKRIPLSAVCLVSLALTSCGFLPKRAREIRQAVWVTRWDYKTASDIRNIVQNCARAGFDTILFQVRGNGTVAYRSRIEPWSGEFGHRDPGFDPLQIACEEAREQGIALQAWVNAVPGWRGARPPQLEQQLFHTRPDWFVVDQHKKRQPLRANRYVMLNPCLPEVRAHVASICEEIALRYPVTGVHLDYIRFEDPEGGRDYPRDDRTLELYRQATGLPPDEDAQSWRDWRTAQVTELVREVKRRVRRANPRCLVTAAVYPTPARAADVMQDWVTWISRGYVDAVFPMTYDEDDARFQQRIAQQKAAAGDLPVIVGIGTYKHAKDPGQTLRQLDMVERAGLQGFSMFAYSSFFETGTKVEAVEATARVKRREQVVPRIQGGRVAR